MYLYIRVYLYVYLYLYLCNHRNEMYCNLRNIPGRNALSSGLVVEPF